jgi:MFS family permease
MEPGLGDEAPGGVSTQPESVPASGLGSAFDVLRLPVYRTIWLGTIVSFFAFNTWGPAQGVVAFDLTGNNGAVGIVVFGQGLAQTFFNPISGALADRVSKKNLVLTCQSVAFLTMLTVAILLKTGHISILAMGCASFVVGSMFAFNGPSRNALIGELLPREKLGNAIALIQVGGNFSRTAAPFVAGLLLSWELVGAAGTYFFMAAVMLIVIITMNQIQSTPARQDAVKTSVFEDIRIGYRYVTSQPRLLHCVVSFWLIVALGFSNFVLMPGFSKQVLDAGTPGVGMLLGASAAGGIITSILVAAMANSPNVQKILTASSFFLGISLIATGFAPTLLTAIVCMALVGAGSAAFQCLNNVVGLRRSAPEFYGRVMAMMFVAWGLQALSGLPIGFAADAFGERAVLVGLGALVVVMTVLLAIWDREIGRRHGVEVPLQLKA